MRRKDLIGLEKHLGLVALHGGAVLAASNATALPWMDEDLPLVACCCKTRKGMSQLAATLQSSNLFGKSMCLSLPACASMMHFCVNLIDVLDTGAPNALQAWAQEAAGKLLYYWSHLQDVHPRHHPKPPWAYSDFRAYRF